MRRLQQGYSAHYSDFNEKHLFPLIVSMADKKNLYSPRVSASNMITACYPSVSEANQQELQKIFKRLGV